MAELSKRELGLTEQLLQYEQSMARKYQFCYRFCHDPQLKMKCELMAARHADHYMKLLDTIS